MTIHANATASPIYPPLEDDYFGLKMVMQAIDQRQNAKSTQEPSLPKSTSQSSQNSRVADQSESSATSVGGLPERLSEVDVVEPDAVSASSSVITDHHSIESMRNPSSQPLMERLGQSIQTVSRLSTGVVLVGVDLAAPLFVRSLRGSVEAVAAHYPQEVQELTALAQQGQKKLQELAAYAGGMGERYDFKSEQIGQHWDAVNHSAQALQQHVRQARSQLFGIQKEAYRSALHTGAVIGSVYALSCVAGYFGWGGAAQRNLPSLGWMAAGMTGKMLYDCYYSESFRQFSDVCTEIFSELTQMGQGGFQLSNDLITGAASILHDSSVLLNEAKKADFGSHEAIP
jgi:hypothetical protein